MKETVRSEKRALEEVERLRYVQVLKFVFTSFCMCSVSGREMRRGKGET